MKYVRASTNLPEADFWLIAEGAPQELGQPTQAFDSSHIGILVEDKEKIGSLWLACQLVWSQGRWMVGIDEAKVKRFIGQLALPEFDKGRVTPASYNESQGSSENLPDLQPEPPEVPSIKRPFNAFLAGAAVSSFAILMAVRQSKKRGSR